MKQESSPSILPASLAKQLATLSPEKRALLELRLTQRGLRRAEVNSIPRRTIHDNLPLSFAQERLWFLDQFEPNSALYNISSAVRLSGVFHLEALRQALLALVMRHETLRTTFPAVDGTPHQVIAEKPTLQMNVVDLRSRTDTEREDEALRLATDESQRPFDLTQGPLLRTLLVLMGPEEHLLTITMHHIISDGWSRSVLFRELAALYEACSGDPSAALPPLPIQYADFAVWQRQQLQGAQLEHHLTYWKEHLAEAPPLLALSTDRPRPTQQTYRGASQVFTLPSSLIPALKAISQREGATLFMTLLAAFQVLLARYTGQEDIVVGSPIAGRTHIELEGLIGFFANTVVLRTDLSNNPTFRELLHRVRETALSAYTHQEVPYEKLVAELHPQRHLSHTPLVQVLFALQNVPPSAFTFAGVRSSSVKLDSKSAKFDLSLLVWEDKHGLRGEVEYNTDLFEEATIARLVGHYQTLLDGIVANPEQPIATLPLLTPAEQHQLLVEWNTPQPPYPHDQCAHQLVEAQVARTPNAVAIIFHDQQVTYRELNLRANRLAHYLRTLGVGPEILVGLYMQRSLELVVSILAILKAGGAYLPLDPGYPNERLQFMLEDAQVTFLLTREQMRKGTQGTSEGITLSSLVSARIKVIFIDNAEVQAASGSNIEENNPVSGVAPDNLAYVIYTSGSTGKPKGTMVSHYNVVRLFQSTTAMFDFTAGDTWTLFHSYAFDFSVWEIWGALLYGGKLLVIPYDVSRAPAEFATLIAEQGVTVLNQTPSAFRQLIPHLIARVPPDQFTLRYVIFGGEALELQSLQPWFDRYGDQKPTMINMYGITETTVHVTYRRILIIDLQAGVGSVIGKPLPDLRVYVLDPHQQVVPIGVPGELYVGGAGVARGYLNRPELTTARFIADPFSNTPEAKQYRSGDLVRWREHGELEYLGRIDQQVKLRGFRIELGEIEAVLGQHPTIYQSVVVLREDNPGDKHLVAYVVPTAGQKTTYSEMQMFLCERVPDYMVPAAFVFLEALPLTSNGKIDRRTLPAPQQTRPELEQLFVMPRTQEEKVIARIWCEVLGLEQVGIHDNFFALGGHSLKATQVMARLHTALQVELPLRRFFEAPTIAELATLVSKNHKYPTSHVDLERLVTELENLTDEEAALAFAQFQVPSK